MKHIPFSTRFEKIILMLLFCVSMIMAGDIKLPSKITAVTVYNDQALITRTAKENIPSGIHKIIIPDLAWGMIDRSLKVTGTSSTEVKISDIKIEQIFLDTIPQNRTAELYQQLTMLRTDKNSLERNNILFKSQYDAVDAMKESYTKSLSLENPGQKASVDEWNKLLDFVEKKKKEYADKMESTRREIDQKIAKIRVIEDEIKSIGGAAKKEQKQVTIILNATKSGTVTLEISYLILDAAWIPTYEIRASMADKSLQLVYSGNVKQTSSEDWTDVDLVLSTAKPAASENMPVLFRQTVDTHPVPSNDSYQSRRSSPNRGRSNTEISFSGNTISGKILDAQTGEPLSGANVIIEGTNIGGSANMDGDYVIYNVPDGVYNVRASMIGYQQVTASQVRISKTTGARQTFDLSSASINSQEVVIMADRPLIQKSMTNAVRVTSGDVIVNPEESISSNQVTSSTFSIASKQTIPSDNQNHKVGIALDDIPVRFVYNVVPKILPTAFLVGKGKNPKEYPLLAGEANIFLDNSFVSSIQLKTIMPNDSFSVNLGADEGIGVERKLVNRFSEKVGTFSSKNRLTVEYENVIHNHKKYSIEVFVFDQVPVSIDEKITIEVFEPNPKVMLPNSDGIFQWIVTLRPGEKNTSKVKFAIEYPPDVSVYGLR